MAFVSPEFVLFFCVVTAVFFVVPQRFRWIVLLIASYVFYATWNIQYVVLLAGSTLLNFEIARRMGQSDKTKRRDTLLAVGIILNLVVLGIFKYFNFFSDSIASLFNEFHIDYAAAHLNLLLPVGISFYTFMEMGYLFDVHRKKIQAEKDLGIFAAFVAFFPQLVSGPIGRAPALLPQFKEHKTFDDQRVVEGLRLILWGAFKKIVIADRLAIYVNQVYDHPTSYTGLPLIIATLFFAFQIYCDFSGYSDIAIGLARILGFKLMDNFKQPYFALSLSEFWQRWHISLSNWIREYLFFPVARKSLQLSGGKMPRLVQLLVSIFVMALMGLWHGAAWPFVIWGVLHGIYLGIEGWFRSNRSRLPVPIGTNHYVANGINLALTFTLVTFAWIFFRANTLSDAGYLVTHIFAFPDQPLNDLVSPFGIGARAQFVTALLLIGLLLGVDVLERLRGINATLNRSPRWVRWAVYYGVTAGVLLLGIWGHQEFIYFKF